MASREERYKQRSVKREKLPYDILEATRKKRKPKPKQETPIVSLSSKTAPTLEIKQTDLGPANEVQVAQPQQQQKVRLPQPVKVKNREDRPPKIAEDKCPDGFVKCGGYYVKPYCRRVRRQEQEIKYIYL